MTFMNNDDPIMADFERFLADRRRGGVPLAVGVTRGIWMGGLAEEVPHEALVFLGPENWEGGEELTYLVDRAAVLALIQRLQKAADDAWGPAPET